MPSTKYEGLSYPTHFLKSRVVLLGISLLNTELNKSIFLRDEMSFIHYSLQIKQNIYSICIFRAAAVTQCLYTFSKSIKKNRKKFSF